MRINNISIAGNTRDNNLMLVKYITSVNPRNHFFSLLAAWFDRGTNCRIVLYHLKWSAKLCPS